MKYAFHFGLLGSLLLYANFLCCQSDFYNRLYAKLIFDDIPVWNTDGQRMNEPALFDAFYTVDTVINCFNETKPEVRENVYSGTGYFIVVSEYELDISSNEKDFGQVDVLRTMRDENGNFISKEIIFSIPKRVLENIDRIRFFENNDSDLINLENESWTVREIKSGNDRFYLDSCHQSYRLQFTDANHYRQSFNENGLTCEATVDPALTQKDGTTIYWYSTLSHIITSKTGRWKTVGGRLHLLDQNNSYIRSYDYRTEGPLLKLKYTDEYEIVLIRT